MKTIKMDLTELRMNILSVSISAALVAMFTLPSFVYAEGEDDVAALTKPTNTVEVGVDSVSDSSAKFGEYNGRNNAGADFIGNFNIRGGDAYNQGDGTTRWELKGFDLGTTSREVGVNLSNQGSWAIGIKYDELQHNITDSYQTPLQGSMGGNTFTLDPTKFGVIVTTNKTGNTSPYGAQALTPEQKSSFHKEDVHSNRKNTTFTAGYNFDPEWNIKFEFNHLDQSGAKLTSAATDASRNNIVPTFSSGGSSYAPKGQAILLLMNPTNYKTDSGNLALNWVGEKGHFSGSYVFSLFRDANNTLAFSNPYDVSSAASGSEATGDKFSNSVGLPMNALGTAPDNQFHQINFNGGYTISPAMKVVGGFSYGRNTQDDSFNNQLAIGSLPKASLDGLVITTHADFKLTDQVTKDFNMNAGIKYNERDNQTPSSTYNFYHIGSATDTQFAMNTPLSNKKTQIELSGDYRASDRQKIHFGYEYEQINRWCNSSPSYGQIMAATTGLGSATGTQNITNASNYYALGSSCVQVPESRENKLLANYRFTATDDLILTAGYAYARRNSSVNNSFYNPMQSFKEGFELPGYVAFFDASRTENLLKAGLNWQATEKLNFGFNGRYTKDDYGSSLGVQSGDAWSVNLDSSYNFSENTIASAYFTYQKRQRDLLNDTWDHKTGTSYTNPNGISAGNGWTNNLESNDSTFGLNVKHGGLLANKLDLVGDLVYSLSTSSYSTALNYSSSSCTATSTTGYTCGALPDIRSQLISLKLAGNYKIDKSSKVTVGYLYQHLNSSDYYYNAYQTGYTPTSMMPTNQQSPNYSVSMLYTAYVYEFR